MRTLGMSKDMAGVRLIRAAQRMAGWVGIGLVSVDDPDYTAICDIYRTISSAYQRGDYSTILTSLDRDYTLTRPDKVRMKRHEVQRQLQVRMGSQIESNYREEPAHIIIRGKRATVATRIYSKSICRRGDGLVELHERGENLTTWYKMKGGWKRLSTQIRYYEENTEWLAEPIEPEVGNPRVERITVMEPRPASTNRSSTPEGFLLSKSQDRASERSESGKSQFAIAFENLVNRIAPRD